MALVHCEDLDIIEAPAGSGAATTIKVLKRYGATQNLGQIKAWEERLNPNRSAHFQRAGFICARKGR